ncbi:hypothetical protein [Mesorhizobium sp. M0276]|uniref:hypothetical protein n=1 Tax=Mesorhizobium sp. M0276 TaxID=2956928 RepID=UPI00333AAC07
MAETMPRKFTVCAAFYDIDCRATITVEAEDFTDACEKAISAIDNGDIGTDRKTWDPTSTFVYGVVEGDGDPGKECKTSPCASLRTASTSLSAMPVRLPLRNRSLASRPGAIASRTSATMKA